MIPCSFIVANAKLVTPFPSLEKLAQLKFSKYYYSNCHYCIFIKSVVVGADVSPPGVTVVAASSAHLIQSPVGAQRQQIIVLSLQNLTCLGKGGDK